MMDIASIAFPSVARDASPVDTVNQPQGKHDTDRPSASADNAFAATLASVMNVPMNQPAPADEKGMESELDARMAGVGNANHEGKPGFAAAAGARSAAATASVTEANADADALSPEFRAKLGRVVNRMHDEFGHDVELVEGFRSQSRQDFLYAQGRTRPGDVVTWTKSSRHTLGLAADLKVDGTYDNPIAYQRLAQIAAQEGLRTLGAKDPGHVELPSHGGAAAWGAGLDTVNIDNGVSRAVGLALSQTNAGDDATSGGTDVDSLNGLLSRVSRGTGSSPFAIHQPSMGGNNNAMSGGMYGDTSRRDRQGSSRTADVAGADPTASVAGTATVAQMAQVAQVAQVAHVADVAHVAAPVANGATPTVGAAAGSNAAERVGRMLDVRDATPAQPLSHVTLNLENAAGGTDRITVQMHGAAVDTAISLGDSNRADRMSLRVGELQHALEQHGLEAASIHVGSTAADSGAGWTPRQGSDQGGQQGRASLNNRDNRQDADNARQRSRKEQHGGTQK